MNRTKLITYLLLLGGISLIVSNISYAIYYKVWLVMMFFTITNLLYKEFRRIFPYFVSYMLNTKSENFDKRVEKPRLLFYLIFGSLSLISFLLFYFTDVFSKSAIINSVIFFLLFAFSCWMLYYTWTPGFSEYLIPKVQKNFVKKDKDFEIGLSKNHLANIFDGLYEHNLIEIIRDYDELDKYFFANILLNGKIPDQTCFKLLMDHRQTYLIWKLLSEKSTGFTLGDFLLIFENNNGKTTRDKVESSFHNNKVDPKKKDIIINIFKKADL